MRGRGLGRSALKVRGLLELISLETTEGVAQACLREEGWMAHGWSMGSRASRPGLKSHRISFPLNCRTWPVPVFLRIPGRGGGAAVALSP